MMSALRLASARLTNCEFYS